MADKNPSGSKTLQTSIPGFTEKAASMPIYMDTPIIHAAIPIAYAESFMPTVFKPSLQPVWGVKQLVDRLRGQVRGLGRLMVEGEIIKVDIRSQSRGQAYIMLRDLDGAQEVLKIVAWKDVHEKYAQVLVTGKKVIVHGTGDVYQSSLQIELHHIEEVGLGKLIAELELLKSRLRQEGLMDESIKRPVPPWARSLLVFTSADGVVWQDIHANLLSKRGMKIWIWPVRVEGRDAAQGITSAMKRAFSLIREGHPIFAQIDAIALARGGGSFESLLPFSNEDLVRTARLSPVPLISAIGHQTDHPILDDVADVRVATPSAIGTLFADRSTLNGQLVREWSNLERLVHSRFDKSQGKLDLYRTSLSPRSVKSRHQHSVDRMTRNISILAMTVAGAQSRRLQALSSRHQHLELLNPRERLRRAIERLAQRSDQLNQALVRKIKDRTRKTSHVWDRLAQHHPQRRVMDQGEHLNQRFGVVHANAQRIVRQASNALQSAHAIIEQQNPLHILNRGYAIVFRSAKDAQRTATRAHQVEVGERLSVRFADGDVHVIVQDVDVQ